MGLCAPTTARDNLTDNLMADHGPARRAVLGSGPTRPAGLMTQGQVPDALIADPSSIEVIVCSHGHFDHTTGLDGLIRALGPVNLPVLIHPHFWRRRRLQLPGREPRELPTTSRRALTEPLIPRVLDDLAALTPAVLVPAHCKRRGSE